MRAVLLGLLCLQRLIECFAKLRQAFPASRPNQDLEAYKAKHHGRDPLGEQVLELLVHVCLLLLLTLICLVALQYDLDTDILMCLVYTGIAFKAECMSSAARKLSPVVELL